MGFEKPAVEREREQRTRGARPWKLAGTWQDLWSQPAVMLTILASQPTERAS